MPGADRGVVTKQTQKNKRRRRTNNARKKDSDEDDTEKRRSKRRQERQRKRADKNKKKEPKARGKDDGKSKSKKGNQISAMHRMPELERDGDDTEKYENYHDEQVKANHCFLEEPNEKENFAVNGAIKRDGKIYMAVRTFNGGKRLRKGSFNVDEVTKVRLIPLNELWPR